MMRAPFIPLGVSVEKFKAGDRVKVGYTPGTFVRADGKWAYVTLDESGKLPHRVPLVFVDPLEVPEEVKGK